MASRMIKLFGVNCGRGGPDHGPSQGPEVLRQMGLLAALRRAGLEAGWAATLETPLGDRLDSLGALSRELADEVATAIASGALPLVIGGDHSMAAGTWRGVARAYATAGAAQPGLVWIDAHLDAHTPDTSRTGNPHGMPLAALLGHGAEELAGIPGPRLDPARLAVVAARSYEAEELALLRQLGVRIFTMDDIRRRGLGAVLEEAVQIAGGPAGGGFGISLDLDALNPLEAPGVSTPVEHGLAGEVLRRCLRGLLRNPRLSALEIAEFNPERDRENRTARLAIDLVESAGLPDGDTLKEWEGQYGARNYAPLPVVLAQGEGSWLWDVDGQRYLDLMSAYSAVSFGHAHPRLLAVLRAQAGRLAVTSRAFYSERLPLFLKRLTDVTGYARALPVNTGLEAVETALKAARKWGHEVKGIAPDQAEIIACAGNFHGRSITIVGLSTEDQYRRGFGPFPPGLKTVPYGDAAALEAAITPHTAAFLVEPVQGEGGIILPPRDYLARCADICRRHQVLLIADEVQTGLGRTGRLLASEHAGIRPDGVILGKALGGGLLPVSAFLADDEVMQVFTPGDHGSTFGGNALAASIALEALDLLIDESLVERSATLGAHLLSRLQAMDSPAIRAVRGLGLFAGLELEPRLTDAREFCERLLQRGVLSKDTHHTVVRLAPPLTISQGALDWGLDQVEAVAEELGRRFPRAA
ncbi:hypothetical protein AZSI13_15250 [Azospira sp. I13]|uniref:ornithine--oxo-acid transaminase n=1 Tax=Azospira sp. I13 TaxID=1765050 RepID=UPI000D4DAC80|nr:ornithine--oxo-acid transaminase [Azospira sp. I13]GBG02198.1 hypothetical protein AZSI13_15250 [Azospira sp. I13]